MIFIKSIAELDQNDLPLAGGKGANLGALLQAGLPVPGGFVITTDAYRAFVAANALDAGIQHILGSARLDDPAELESAAQKIRARFINGQTPAGLAAEIRRAYASLHQPPTPVAVRSSATVEDLPDLSFAGQQDTYLNILGEETLLEAVVHCWASLWTGRAIGYRARNAISHDGIALAVVVQEMIQSEVSGVLFSANPLTGKLSETVIDAAFGLGEALVSGRVEPDHYVVDTNSDRILSKTLGAKALRIQGRPEGGTSTIEQDGSQIQALPDEQILALARLGRRSTAYFGAPQDMEWAWANGKLSIVQSRPITSLYPLPENTSAEPLEVFLAFGVWQGMLDPYTPLGQDIFDNLIAGIGALFNAKINPAEQRVLCAAGSRLYLNITGLMHSSLGHRILDIAVEAIDPVSGEIVRELLKDPRFAVTRPFSIRERLNLVRGFFPFAGNIIFNLLLPRRGRLRFQNLIEKSNRETRAACAGAQSLAELVTAINTNSQRLVKNFLPALVAGVASGQGIALQSLVRMAEQVPQGPELVMDLTRGLPHNVTTEMDLALWKIAQGLRAEPTLLDTFLTTDAAGLADAYQRGALPGPAQAALAGFLMRYGMRGVGEIDLGRRRWKEDPQPVFQALKSYLQIEEAKAPDLVFQRGAEQARQAGRELAARCTALPNGRPKAGIVRAMLIRFRELGGLRESPKYALVQRMGLFHDAFLAYGRQYTERGVFSEPEDIFYLHQSELAALGSGEARDWQALIAARRADYRRELRRKRSPRILLSDGTAYYASVTEPAQEDEHTLSGSPVSAGAVDGRVHVIFDPYSSQIAPGEILVCPATDPAWTPLFLSAGGLVMEVGGMMTHGSVVAREYGIPAVVGVRNATRRLQTGQMVHLNGSTGKITILPD